jgi:hypothetical protein
VAAEDFERRRHQLWGHGQHLLWFFRARLVEKGSIGELKKFEKFSRPFLPRQRFCTFIAALCSYIACTLFLA